MTFPSGEKINVDSALGHSEFYTTTGSAAILGGGSIENLTSTNIIIHTVIDFHEYGGVYDFGEEPLGAGGMANWMAPPNGDGTISWHPQ